MKTFAITDKKRTRIVYIGLHDDEADCWKIFLGWPDEAEIDDAKRKYNCYEVPMGPLFAALK